MSLLFLTVLKGETNKITACFDDLKYPTLEEKGCVCFPYTVHSIGSWSSVSITIIAYVITRY